MKKLFERSQPAKNHAGKSLAIAMSIYDVSAGDLANVLGTSRQAMHRTIYSKSMQDPERLKVIAKFFGLSVKQFLQLGERPLSSAHVVFCNKVVKTFKERKVPQAHISKLKASMEMTSKLIELIEKG